MAEAQNRARQVLAAIAGFFIRVLAFVRKEVVAILRQTRLVLALIIGPFLILLLFGVGYRNTPRTLRAIAVVPENSNLEGLVTEYLGDVSPQLKLVGVTHSAEEADARLRNQEVELVIVAPPNPLASVENNEQALIQLYHYEIDPYEETYVQVMGRTLTEALNREFLLRMAEEGKQEASSLQQYTEQARADAAVLRQALTAGDTAVAVEAWRSLQSELGLIRLAAGSSLALLAGLQETAGADTPGEAGEIMQRLTALQDQVASLETGGSSAATADEQVQQATALESDLRQLDDLLAEFRRIDSRVLVTPFRNQVLSITQVAVDPMFFFTPAVIALLLQHTAITLAALSIVRERLAGALELFRAAPVSPLEILLGKYISYFLLVSGLAAVLTLLVIFLLGVPMLGSWGQYVFILAIFLFASLGFGFHLSLSARSDSQAVQYAMIILLASIFFSGFFLALYRLWLPVRIVSWAIPATYATEVLKDIMLRGQPGPWFLYLVLALIGAILFVGAWWRTRQLLRSE